MAPVFSPPSSSSPFILRTRFNSRNPKPESVRLDSQLRNPASRWVKPLNCTAMAAVSSPASPIILSLPIGRSNSKNSQSKSGGVEFRLKDKDSSVIGRCGLRARRIRAVSELSAVTADMAEGQVTWQIIVGALAGVTPFVVAGIEFSKRIVAQRRCKVCGGSGLVLRDNKWVSTMAIMETVLLSVRRSVKPTCKEKKKKLAKKHKRIGDVDKLLGARHAWETRKKLSLSFDDDESAMI